MRRLFVAFLLLFNNINYIENDITKVDKIEYSAKNYSKDFIIINVYISASQRDVVELKISFYDKDKRRINESYYSSALTIQGSKNTEAKIPVQVNDKMYYILDFLKVFVI